MIIKKGKTQITFVYQPQNGDTRRVDVVGTFNDWNPDLGRMTRQKDGTFRKRLVLPEGRHQYKFIVDGQWVEDPEAEGLAPNEFGGYNALLSVG